MLARSTPGLEKLILTMTAIWQRVLKDSKYLTPNCQGVIIDTDDPTLTCEIDDQHGFAGYITEIVSSLIRQNKLEVNEYLMKYTLHMIPKWAASAIQVLYNLHRDREYMVKKNEIKIIDLNTGVIQERMQWHNGIHQFLQMKESLAVTPENLITNFMSNVTFFRRYKKNIFGLTGTLGSLSN
jgi:preprotein translocase subunit SecA